MCTEKNKYMSDSCNTDVERLILLCRAGDETAFEELVHIYEPMIAKTARDLTLDVCEVYSDACLSVRRAAASYDIGGKVTFGLYAKICVSRAMLDYAKKNRKIVGNIDINIEDIAVSDGVQRRLEREEERRVLDQQARTLLSDLEYEVFSGCMRGDKTAEIADRLGVSAKVVDNAKARMLKRLRAGLAVSSEN